MEKIIFGISLLIRIIFIIYGEYQDSTMIVKYTDIDYIVFSDAARFVMEGSAPYERSTYRYTPLLAYFLTPNVFFHRAFGKLLFVLSDLVVGWLIVQLLKKWGDDWRLVCFWLLNPVVINISTRGNAESLISLMVILTLYLAETKRVEWAAVVFGLSVHFKIYPILFAFPLLFWLDWREGHLHLPSSFQELVYRLRFALISATVFLLLTVMFAMMYGQVFLQETYFHHITRKDIAHNFSVYFYSFYLLSGDDGLISRYYGLLAFLPQLIFAALFTVKFFKSPALCCFLQTLVFVMFNKVITVQYFVWYFALLPLALPSLRPALSLVRGFVFFLVWQGSQLLWLFFAYHLEFRGMQTFSSIWFSGLVVFLVNVFLLGEFVRFSHIQKIKNQ